MFKGYFQLGGVEVINSERTFRYVRNNLPQFPLQDCNDCGETLHQALGDTAYESPITDDAPWVDSHNPATQGFYGFYPLELTGSLDDTTVSTVTEGLLDGGYIGAPRAAAREMRYRGLMIARDELALHAGMTWLKAALHPQPCQAHGGSCAGATACVYAACPEIGVCHEPIPQSSSSIPIGAVSPSTPFLHLFGPDGLQTAHFEIPVTDGFAFTWGARYLNDPNRWYEQRGPVVSRRTNYLINPSFTDPGLAGWTTTGSGTLTRVATGGVDGGAFANVTPTTPSTRRFNWMAEPSFETFPNPEGAGWLSNALGGMQRVADVDAPQGDHYAQAQWDPTQPDLWIQGNVNEPAGTPAGYGGGQFGGGQYGGSGTAASSRVVSFWIGQSTHDIEIETRSDHPTGPVNDTITIPASQLTAAWQRVSLPSSSTIQTVFLRVIQLNPSVNPEPLRVDGFQVEPGLTVTSYFDGGSPDAPGVDYTWVDGDPTKGAIETSTTADLFVLRSADTITAFGDIIASFALRSITDAGIAQVKAELVSVDDGTILGTADYDLTATWTRYSLTSTFGRNVYLRLTGSKGRVDIDQAMIEKGTTLWPYFDGDVPSFSPFGAPTSDADEYTMAWTGVPQRSPSTMTWTAGLNPATGTQLLTLEEVCDPAWQISLEAIAGTLADGILHWQTRAAIPAEAQAIPFERNYHDVATTSGPTVIGEYAFHAGAAVEVEFIVVAGTPFAYGTTDDLLDREPMSTLPTSDWTDVACAIPDDSPILDPDCPPLPAAPRPPAVPNICIDDIAAWKRFSYEISADRVSGWSQMLPTILLTTKTEDVRQVRVRFTPNPFGWAVDEIDPCAYCSEFILSYLPPNTELTVDGLTKTAFASISGGAPKPASHLLYGTDGTPMTWPELSCGIPYVMTVDVPTAVPDLALSLALTQQE